MKHLNHCFSLLLTLLITFTLQAQTADEIISKYIDAMGGKDKWATVTSLRLENTVDIGGNSAPSTIVISNGKGYRNDADFGGQKTVQVYTSKSGWTVNPFIGISEPQAMPDAQYKGGMESIYIAPLLDYAAIGLKVETAGQEKVGNVNAHKLKVTNAGGVVSYYYFDPTSYYIIQTTNTADFGGQSIEVKMNYSDYKKTDFGIVIPFTTDVDFGGQFAMNLKTNKVEFNGAVDPTIFDMK